MESLLLLLRYGLDRRQQHAKTSGGNAIRKLWRRPETRVKTVVFVFSTIQCRVATSCCAKRGNSVSNCSTQWPASSSSIPMEWIVNKETTTPSTSLTGWWFAPVSMASKTSRAASSVWERKLTSRPTTHGCFAMWTISKHLTLRGETPFASHCAVPSMIGSIQLGGKLNAAGESLALWWAGFDLIAISGIYSITDIYPILYMYRYSTVPAEYHGYKSKILALCLVSTLYFYLPGYEMLTVTSVKPCRRRLPSHPSVKGYIEAYSVIIMEIGGCTTPAAEYQVFIYIFVTDDLLMWIVWPRL